MDLDAVCTRLAAAVKAYGIEGLSCLDYVPDRPEPPVIYPGEITTAFAGRAVTFDGVGDVEIAWTVLTSAADDASGQRLLRKYMAPFGPTSIRAALESARGEPGECALAGACDDYSVRGIREHRLYIAGEARWYGAKWIVHVIGGGDG